MSGHRHGHRPEKFLLRDIPSNVKRSLAFCLDEPKRNDWKALARELHIAEPTIRKMDEMSRGPKPSSPTICLLKEYERVNSVADVEQLFILLGRIEQGEGMLILSRFVNPDLYKLMPENAHHRLHQQGPVPQPYPQQPMMGPQYRLPLVSRLPLNGGHALPPHGGCGPQPNGWQPRVPLPGPHQKHIRVLPVSYPDPGGYDRGYLATSPDSPYYSLENGGGDSSAPREAQFGEQESVAPVDHTQSTRVTQHSGGSRAASTQQRHNRDGVGMLDESGRPSFATTNGDSANQRRHEHARQGKHGLRGEAQNLGREMPEASFPVHIAEPNSTPSVVQKVTLMAERVRMRTAVAMPPGAGLMHSYSDPRDLGVTQPDRPGQNGARHTFSVPPQHTSRPSQPEETRSPPARPIISDDVVPPPVPMSMQHILREVEQLPAAPPTPQTSPEHGQQGHSAAGAGSGEQDGGLTLSMENGAIPPGLLQLITFKYTVLDEKTKGFEVRNSSQVLGQGGFGTVYKVNLNGSVCAVKKLSIKATGETPLQGFQSMAEFQTELQTLLCMRCNFLVTLMGYSEDGPEPCLVYEYMENGSLEAWLFEMSPPRCVHGPLTGSQRLSISRDVAKALRYLHHTPSDPVIHCNVKSSNILLGQHMNAKLADFGHVRRQLSASCSGRTALSTRSKYAVRASTYMDPDMYLGKLDPKVDIYGFGVVLLEMLTGQKAYDETRDQPDLIINTEETLYCRAKDPQRRLLFIAMCDETLGVDLVTDELMMFGDVTASCLDDRAARPGADQLDLKLFQLISFRDIRLQS